MGRKRKNRGTKFSHEFFCRSCFFAGKKEKDPFKGAYYTEDSIYVCPGLSRHLLANRDCEKYYIESVSRLDDGNLDYESSLLQYREPVVQPPRLWKHTPSEIGVVCTNGSPSNDPPYSIELSDVNGHRLLNQQVIYNSLRSSLAVPVINTALLVYDKDNLLTLHKTQPFPNYSEEENNDDIQFPIPSEIVYDGHLPGTTGNRRADSSSAAHKSIETQKSKKRKDNPTCRNVIPPYPVPVFTRLAPQLIAEVELLNILQRNNLPMNTYKLIIDWAVRCNNPDRAGANITQFRKREAVISDVCDFLPRVDYSFKPYGINMLPDNKLIQVYV